MKSIQVTLNETELQNLSDTLWRRRADQFVSRSELENLRFKIDKAIVDINDTPSKKDESDSNEPNSLEGWSNIIINKNNKS